jgi:hypothetical protein
LESQRSSNVVDTKEGVGSMKAYLNYPNQRITMHHDARCSSIQQQRKAHPRVVRVTPQNLRQVLADFSSGVYKFAPNSAENDLWLDISLSTTQHEESLVYVIQELLGLNYTRLGRAEISAHC